jgi:type I restriction enzyme S subunit
MEAVWPGERLDLSQRREKAQVAVGYTRFQSGDVLVPKITPTFEAARSILTPSLATHVGAGTTELHVLRPGPRIDGRYLAYIVNSGPFLRLGEAEMYGVAGQKRVPDEFVRDFVVDLPSLNEQRRIANFLYAETARIDRLATLQTEVWSRLREREDSYLESLLVSGERTWRPLAALTDDYRPIMYGIVLPGPHVPGGVPIVKGGDVAASRLHPDMLSRASQDIEGRYARSRLQGGDLVFAIRGSVGEVSTVPDSLAGANLTQDAARISIGKRTDRRWLEIVLRAPSVKQQVEARVTGATIRGINIWDLKRVLVPTPSQQEQIKLAKEAAEVIQRHDDLSQMIDAQLNLLADRRQALITAAVTGQFDVATARGADLS